MFYDFQTTTHAKWILTGEHAVLRNKPALVFPVIEKSLTLFYRQDDAPLSLFCRNDYSDNIQNALTDCIQNGFNLLNIHRNNLSGSIEVSHNIPIGSGLGASAALCVAVARWFTYLRLIDSHSCLTFAKQLENFFHGQSSGVDIAGASNTTGVYFQAGQQKPIIMAWKPIWYLSFSGEKSHTSDCIQQIHYLWETEPTKAQHIDNQMSESTKMALCALKKNESSSLHTLKHAIELASDCFKQWGLITPSMAKHMSDLMSVGALAAKPTGSGGGGYVLSLWKTPAVLHALESSMELIKL